MQAKILIKHKKFIQHASQNFPEHPRNMESFYSRKRHVLHCKLTLAKLPANAVNFTGGPHVKRPHTLFTCVTCNLPVRTGNFTRVYVASSSRKIHANCLQPHVNLPEYSGYFTGNFTCGTHANLSAIGLQNCLFLQAKVKCNLPVKNLQFQAKIPENAGKNTDNRRQK